MYFAIGDMRYVGDTFFNGRFIDAGTGGHNNGAGVKIDLFQGVVGLGQGCRGRIHFTGEYGVAL